MYARESFGMVGITAFFGYIILMIAVQPSLGNVNSTAVNVYNSTECNGTGTTSGSIFVRQLQNDYVASYDAMEAAWTFHLNLTVPKRREDDECDYVSFVIILFLTSNDNGTWTFFKNSTERQFETNNFIRTDNDQQVNVMVVFDHAYSGTYELGIKTCTYDADLILCDCYSIKKASLCPVKTGRIGQFDVSKMNISMRMEQSENGIKVDYSVDYKRNNSYPFIKFKEFIVELIYHSNDISAWINPSLHTIKKIQTKWNSVEFLNCSTCNINSSCFDQMDATVCYLPLPTSRNFSIAVNPLDSRCNLRAVSYADGFNDFQVTKSASMTECRRICKVPYGEAHHSASVISRGSSGLAAIPRLVILLVILEVVVN